MDEARKHSLIFSPNDEVYINLIQYFQHFRILLSRKLYQTDAWHDVSPPKVASSYMKH